MAGGPSRPHPPAAAHCHLSQPSLVPHDDSVHLRHQGHGFARGGRQSAWPGHHTPFPASRQPSDPGFCMQQSLLQQQLSGPQGGSGPLPMMTMSVPPRQRSDPGYFGVMEDAMAGGATAMMGGLPQFSAGAAPAPNKILPPLMQALLKVTARRRAGHAMLVGEGGTNLRSPLVSFLSTAHTSIEMHESFLASPNLGRCFFRRRVNH